MPSSSSTPPSCDSLVLRSHVECRAFPRCGRRRAAYLARPIVQQPHNPLLGGARVVLPSGTQHKIWAREKFWVSRSMMLSSGFVCRRAECIPRPVKPLDPLFGGSRVGPPSGSTPLKNDLEPIMSYAERIVFGLIGLHQAAYLPRSVVREPPNLLSGGSRVVPPSGTTWHTRDFLVLVSRQVCCFFLLWSLSRSISPLTRCSAALQLDVQRSSSLDAVQ